MNPDLDLESLMRRAINLALKGEGFVHPNPLVGAILLKDGKIIGEGYHMEVGQPHAEINAIAAARVAGHDVRGCTMVVTLEPCAHFGRTPPCVEALVAEGISEVFIGMIDPNPKVSGRGLAFLREHGIRVTERILEDECAEINEEFIKYITRRRPYVAVKTAMTLDGKIATRTGKSQWISSTEALRFAHRLRHRYQGIMVGAGTVRVDNPQLTCRIEGERVSQPVRIIVDGFLSIPVSSKVVSGGLPGKTLIATTEASDPEKRKAVSDAGCELLVFDSPHGTIDLAVLMIRLGECKIASLMIEGGPTLIEQALRAKVVDKMYVVIAPKIFGGVAAPTAVGGLGVDDVDDAWRLSDIEVEWLGVDLLITGKIR